MVALVQMPAVKGVQLDFTTSLIEINLNPVMLQLIFPFRIV